MTEKPSCLNDALEKNEAIADTRIAIAIPRNCVHFSGRSGVFIDFSLIKPVLLFSSVYWVVFPKGGPSLFMNSLPGRIKNIKCNLDRHSRVKRPNAFVEELEGKEASPNLTKIFVKYVITKHARSVKNRFADLIAELVFSPERKIPFMCFGIKINYDKQCFESE